MFRTLMISVIALGCLLPRAGVADDLDDVEARRVFVPVEDLDAIISKDQRGLLLPRDEFLKLVREAKANSPKEGDIDKLAPGQIVISGATYSVKFDGEQIVINAVIKLAQAKAGWQIVALPLAGMSVEGAKHDDKPARLGRDNGGNLIVLNDTRGEHTLNLELSGPLTAVGADKVASVGLLPGAAGTLMIAVPAGKHLQIDGLSVARPAANDQPATYELAVGGKRTAVALQLTDRQRERTTDALLFATTGSGLRVAPGEVTWHAVTTLQAHGSPIDRLVCVVPKSLEITDVDSSGLEAWELSDNLADANSTKITLNYRQPFEGSRRIDFRGVMAVPAGESWRVPTLTINQVTSHIGRCLVQHAPAVRLRTVESVGVRTATVSEADLKSFESGAGFQPAAPSGQVGNLPYESMLFDIWREDFSLGFVVQPKDQTVQASISSIFDLTASGLDLITVATMETSFAPLFELEVSLKADWLLTSISVNGQSLPWQVRTKEDEPGINHVRVALPQPLKPGQSAKLEVRAHRDPDGWPVEDQPVEVELPELRLPQSSVTEGTYVVKADADLDVVPGDITGLDPANVPVPGTRLGFAYQDTKFTGVLRVERKPSRVAARTLTFARLDKQTLHAHFETELEITGGGLRVFDVTLPELAGRDLRFQLVNAAARIVEQTSAAGEKGELIWTLRLDRHLVGTGTLVVTSVSRRLATPSRPAAAETRPVLVEPQPAAPESKPVVMESRSTEIPSLKLKQADRHNGYIAIEAEGDQRLTITAQDGSKAALPEVDPIDLPAPLMYQPAQRIVAAYRYFTGSPNITIADERFDRLAVPTAICKEAHIASVLSPAGEFQHKATFKFTAVGVQSLRVQLPEWTDGKNQLRSLLWAALIDGRPTEIRRTDGSFLIPLAASDDPTAVRELTMFYRSGLRELTGTGQMKQQPPELTVLNGAGVSQPIQLLDQKWDLSYPPDLRLTDSHGAFVPDPKTPLDRANWLSDLPQSLSLPDRDGIASRLIWIAGVALLIVMVLLVRMKRVRRLAGVVVVLGVIGVLIALLLPGVQSARNAARRSDVSGRTMEMYEAGENQPGDPHGFIDGSSKHFNAAGYGIVKVQPPPTAMPQAPPTAMEPTTLANEAKSDLSIRDEFKKELSESRSGLQKAIKESLPRPEMPRSEAATAAPPAKKPADAKTRRTLGSANQADADDGVMILRGNEQDATQVMDQVRELERRKAGGGLLSLTMSLESQAGAATKTFRYIGTETAGSGIGLELDYENRAAGWNGRWLWVAGLAFVAWLLPPSRRGWRSVWAVLGLTLPLALAAIAPASWQNTLDGIFFGTLAAVALWTVRCVGEWFCDALPRMKTKSFWARPMTKASVLSMAIVFSGSANAQPQPATQNAAPAAAPANPNPDIPARPTIVIPYDDPKEPLAAKQVYLPYPKFVELWNAAHPELKRPQPAPWHGQVTEALFVVTPKGRADAKGDGPTIATVRGRVTLFAGQPMWVPIPLKNGVLTETKLNDQPAVTKVIEVNGESLVAVRLETVGLHVFDLIAELPIQQAGPTGQLTLQLAPVPAGRLLFTPDGDDVAFRVNGASNLYRTWSGVVGAEAEKLKGGEGEKKTYFEVAINAGGEVRLAWQPKRMDGAVDAIVQADSTTAVQVEDAGVRIDSRWQFKVPRGAINDVSFALPKELKVRAISGADVGGWELAENVDGRVLRVFLRRAVGDQTAVTFELFVESRIADEAVSLSVPAFAPLGVSRDFGTVGLFAQPQFALKNVAAKGLTQINAKEFVVPPLGGGTNVPPQGGTTNGAVSAYRYTARPFELGFAAQRRAAESTGFAEHALVVERRKVRMSSRLRWELAGALRSSVSVQLPVGWLPVDVDATALQDWHVDATTNVLTVEFSEPRIGAVEVVLQGNVPKEPEDAIAEITAPVPLELSKLVTQAAVWFDAAYQPTINTSNGWKTSDPEHCSEELRMKLGRPAKFVFTSNVLVPEILGFDIARAQPKLSADAVTMVMVSDTAVDYSLALQWKIADAAADTFSFTTPDWLAGKLDFQGAGIRQTKFESAGKDSKRTRWTVMLQDPIGSRYFLLATATLPPPEKREVVGPTIVFDRADGTAGNNATDGAAAAPGEGEAQPESVFAPLETQRQYVVVINISSSQLVAVGDVGETVPRDELPIVVDQSLVDQATAVVRVKGQGAGGPKAAANGLPTWSINSYAAQAGAPASVNLADLTTVLAADGTWRMQCLYTIKNRSRQFLALQLPEKSQALSVFVGDQPARLVELKKADHTYQLIALPKTSEADLSFQVKLVLSGRLPTSLPRGLRFWSKELELPVPTVVSLSDDKEYGIPVARTLWAVHVPKDWSAKPVSDPNRNNLNEQAEDTATVALTATLLQEANELMRVIEGTNYRSSQRMQAQNNLKQLGLALHNYGEGLNARGPRSDEGRKLVESLNDFEAKQADLENRIIIDGASNFYVAKDQQQAAIARAAEARNDSASNTKLFFSQGGQQGLGFQRQVIVGNNDALINLNGGNVFNGEDVNGNGVLDVGEDVNGNGVLDFSNVSGPAGSVSVTPDGPVRFKLNIVGIESQPSLKPQASRSSGIKQSTGKGVSEADRANRRKVAFDQLG